MNTYKKTYIALTFAVLFMFSFSYMLVPLYDIFCEITGLNGKTNQERVNSREKLVEVIQSKTIDLTRDGVCDLLQGIPTSPINKISEAFDDIQSKARGVIQNWNGNPVLASPLRFISERE